MFYLAFFGTGECDPNKDLKQLLAVAGFVLVWYVVYRLLRKISTLDKGSGLKIALKSLVIFLAAIGSIVLFLATWVGLACGR